MISEGECGNYEQLVTLTATDECGNSTEYQFTISVNDTEAPTFVEALPGDLSGIECDAIPAADVLTATDNCDAVDVNFTEEQFDGACANAFTLVRTTRGEIHSIGPTSAELSPALSERGKLQQTSKQTNNSTQQTCRTCKDEKTILRCIYPQNTQETSILLQN